MIGIHVTFTIPPADTEKYFRWKAAASPLLRKAPGFISRSLHHSVEQPDVYYTINYWETLEQMQAVGASAEFAAAKEEVGLVPGAWPSELFHVTEIFNEGSELPGYAADGRPMLGVHVEFVCKPGKEDLLLAWKTLEGTEQRRTPGFLKRSLHQNVEQPNVFYYLSYWETQAQMESFAAGEWFKTAAASINRAPGDYTATLVHVTEVINETSDLSPASA